MGGDAGNHSHAVDAGLDCQPGVIHVAADMCQDLQGSGRKMSKCIHWLRVMDSRRDG